ncbi:hypothetical protein ACH9EU_16505 [Kocuria sp. M1R5S2]|uniref:hypothetical protein n=1 Tax=Kocuria rhizosphaerae TaxID=3376285 RepID=UPI0037B905C2
MVQKGAGGTPRGGSHDGDDRRPPRRESPEVYRRRRIMAALAAGVLLVLVAVGVVQAVASMLGSDEPEPTPAAASPAPSAAPTTPEPFADFTPRPDPDASATASSTASASARPEEPVEECGSELLVRASTDRDTYTQDAEPVLVLTLENTGEDPCRVDAGTSQMVYEVSSGSDSVFDSRHCQAGSEDREVTVEPEQELSARLTWNGARSAEGCPADGEQAMPGYYRLVVSLGERSSEPAPFVLE